MITNKDDLNKDDLNKNKANDDKKERENIEQEEPGDTSDVFFNYKCTELEEHAMVHPGNSVVEASALASIKAPKFHYLPHIKETVGANLLPNKNISTLQLAGILSACQCHLRFDGNKRVGFFLADGAGVGKGRQIASIIADSFARGSERAIWLSVSVDLAVDAQRDFSDLGFHGIKIISGGKELDSSSKKAFGPQSTGSDVLFTTYKTLISSSGKRLGQIINWCGGKHFNGCIIFDECHKAKNFVSDSDATDSSNKKGSQTGKCVVELQNMLPNARIVYASATGCSDLKQMAYMDRLGLWGPKKAFPDHEAFVKALGTRGMGSLEMLAIELKAAGLYLSRSLGLQGCDFSIEECGFTEDENQMYNAAVAVWKDIRSSLIRLGKTDSMRQYWGTATQFFRGLIIAFKSIRCVRMVKEEVRKGNSCVIGLQHTGETHIESIHSFGDHMIALPSTVRNSLVKFITSHIAPPQNNGIPEQQPPQPQQDERFMHEQQRLLRAAETLSLPPASLDYIIDELGGPTKVAELTGRSLRIVRSSSSKNFKIQKRAETEHSKETINIEECRNFQKGSKHIAIISDAASTGISLQADNRCQSCDRRRVHITLELPWSADKAIQQLGRTHRSNEKTSPHYVLLMSTLGGERRLVDAVASRLQSMGAITRGDRRATSGFDLDGFILDSKQGRSALSELACRAESELRDGPSTNNNNAHNISISKCFLEAGFNAHKLSISKCFIECGLEEEILKWTEPGKVNVKKFLSRLLCVEISIQNKLFSDFEKELNNTIKSAKADGTFDKGLGEITGSRVHLKESLQITQNMKLYKIQVDRGVSFNTAQDILNTHLSLVSQDKETNGKEQKEDDDDALIVLEEKEDWLVDDDDHDTDDDDSNDDGSGFYISKRKQFGRTLLVLAIRRQDWNFRGRAPFIITRPNTGKSISHVLEVDLKSIYRKFTVEEMEPLWNEIYKSTLSDCIHGLQCKTDRCTSGVRIQNHGILTGAIVSNWEAIERVTERFKLMLSKDLRSMRVMRTEITSGTENMDGITNAKTHSIIGLQFSLNHVAELITALQDQKQGKISDYLDVNKNNKIPQDLQRRAVQQIVTGKNDMNHVSKEITEEPRPVNTKLLRLLERAAQSKISSFFFSPTAKRTDEKVKNKENQQHLKPNRLSNKSKDWKIQEGNENKKRDFISLLGNESNKKREIISLLDSDEDSDDTITNKI